MARKANSNSIDIFFDVLLVWVDEGISVMSSSYQAISSFGPYSDIVRI